MKTTVAGTRVDAIQELRPVTVLPSEKAHGGYVKPHSHEQAQLMYAVEGLIRVHTESGVWVLPPKRALLIPPGVVHDVTMLSPASLRLLYILPASACFIGRECRVIEVSPLLRELIVALAAEPVDYDVPGRGEYLAMLTLSELNAAETVPITIPWPRDRRLVAVCSAILKEPGRLRSIEEWAGEVGASARTLIRLFPKETGLHYRQWLQQVHLAEAFCRLARGESVSSIASAVGYASPSAFTRMFHAALGKTPQHYLTEWGAQPKAKSLSVDET